MNPNKGIIEKSGRIIAKGELVDTDAYQILDSLKAEYQSQALIDIGLVGRRYDDAHLKKDMKKLFWLIQIHLQPM